MKIAVLYTGLSRGAYCNAQNHKEFLVDPHNCDVFFNFWDLYGNSNENKRIEYDRTHGLLTEEEKAEIVEAMNPTAYRFDSFVETDDMLNSLRKTLQGSWPRNVIGMFYSFQRGFELLDSYCQQTSTTYDIVVRMRGDVYFESGEFDFVQPQPNILYSPLRGSFGPLNDREGYGSMDTMRIYHNAFSSVSPGDTVMGEDTFWHYLHTNGIVRESALEGLTVSIRAPWRNV